MPTHAPASALSHHPWILNLTHSPRKSASASGDKKPPYVHCPTAPRQVIFCALDLDTSSHYDAESESRPGYHSSASRLRRIITANCCLLLGLYRTVLLIQYHQVRLPNTTNQLVTNLTLQINHHHQPTHQSTNPPNKPQTQTTPKMPYPTPHSHSSSPRHRLSLLTHSTLGHDVSAAFKASSYKTSFDSILSSRSSETHANETPAPPPSPVDFSFPGTPTEGEGK